MDRHVSEEQGKAGTRVAIAESKMDSGLRRNGEN
jgi:hypothetical protein